VVRRVLLLLLLAFELVLQCPAYAGSDVFSLSVESDQIEFGKPVLIVLRASTLSPTIDSIDLTALNTDFFLTAPWDVNRDEQKMMQQWRFRLYPRHHGNLVVPSLTFNGVKTMPIDIVVTPALEQKSQSPILVTSEISATSMWLNQGFSLSMKIESESPYARFESEIPKQSNMKIVQMPIRTSTRLIDGVMRVEYHLRWRLYPKKQASKHCSCHW
jgi:hypothetical protein